MAYKLDMTGEEFTNWMSSIEGYFGQVYNWSTYIDTQLSSIDAILSQIPTYKGKNPITSSDEDTYTYWASQEPGIYWFHGNNVLGVSTYGYLIHLNPVSHEVQQLYIAAPSGKWYVRGANASGWWSSSGQSTGCGNDYWTQLT